MAGVTSAAEQRPARAVQHHGTIVVVGGGCYGSYYVRQLGRAATAGALTWTRLVVVDRDAACALARDGEQRSAPADGVPAPELVIGEWRDYFARYLGDEPAPGASDAIVPSPLMPHLLYEWVLARAKERWPTRRVETRPLVSEPDVPWRRAAPDGTTYVSFAEWMCPINCIEPARCPHTRGARSWSLPPAVRAYVDAERARGGPPLHGPLIFHCTHRAYGVGMIDTADVRDADAAVRELGEAGPVDVLVGTMSHCHGALNRLSIGA